MEKNQLLFKSFFIGDGSSSQTLDIWDEIPKFVLSHAREVTKDEVIRQFEVSLNGHFVKVELVAAAFATASKKTKFIYPGKREQLVEATLRHLAIQKQIETNLAVDAEKRPVMSISFTLSQLRTRLRQAGHEMTLEQLREALEVLSNSIIRSEAHINNEVHGFSHPILEIIYRRGEGDTTGEKSHYVVQFPQLAVRSILLGAYQPFNFERLMKLDQSLARWIAQRINIRFRQATKGAAARQVSYTLSLRTVLAESGIIPSVRQNENIERVRLALKELKEAGYLSVMMPFKEEAPSYAPATSSKGGRKKILDILWRLFPSDSFAEEIIAGNVWKKQQAALLDFRSSKP